MPTALKVGDKVFVSMNASRVEMRGKRGTIKHIVDASQSIDVDVQIGKQRYTFMVEDLLPERDAPVPLQQFQTTEAAWMEDRAEVRVHHRKKLIAVYVTAHAIPARGETLILNPTHEDDGQEYTVAERRWSIRASSLAIGVAKTTVDLEVVK